MKNLPMKKFDEIIIPSIFDDEILPVNWVELRAQHVVVGCESFLVFRFKWGQDNIHEDSCCFSEPINKELTNRNEWETKKVGLFYDYKKSQLIFNDYSMRVSVYKSLTISEITICRLNNANHATIYANSIEVPKVIMPEIPDIMGISGLEFYEMWVGRRGFDNYIKKMESRN